MTNITDTDPVATPEGVEDDLDTFAASLFGADKSTDGNSTDEESETSAESEDTSHEDDESTDTADEADENSADEGSDESDEEDDPEPAVQKGQKKNRFQERIDDLVGKIRDKDRTVNDLTNRLEQALAKLEELTGEDKKPAAKPQNTEKAPAGLVEPTADDTNEDGSPKYALGEFDPKFLRDLTRYDRAVERAREQEVAEQQKAERQQAEELAALQNTWNEKVNAVKEVYPDYVQKGEALLSDLSDIPADTAVFLTTAIMELDYGPDVFYYLAEHPDEARAIATSSPQKVLTRLGKLDARFELAADEKSGKETKIRSTKAPAPAPRNKGVSVARPAIDPATDDLDAFARELFKKA